MYFEFFTVRKCRKTEWKMWVFSFSSSTIHFPISPHFHHHIISFLASYSVFLHIHLLTSFCLPRGKMGKLKMRDRIIREAVKRKREQIIFNYKSYTFDYWESSSSSLLSIHIRPDCILIALPPTQGPHNHLRYIRNLNIIIRPLCR